jgi:hypothetical protein
MFLAKKFEEVLETQLESIWILVEKASLDFPAPQLSLCQEIEVF